MLQALARLASENLELRRAMAAVADAISAVS
jgi:hypothetical protein